MICLICLFSTIMSIQFVLAKRTRTHWFAWEEEGLQIKSFVSNFHINVSKPFLIIIFFFNRDFQKKRDVIKTLKQKALEKNPDEFYFIMTRTQMKVTTKNISTT